jgi:hypothetical protein
VPEQNIDYSVTTPLKNSVLSSEDSEDLASLFEGEDSLLDEYFKSQEVEKTFDGDGKVTIITEFISVQKKKIKDSQFTDLIYMYIMADYTLSVDGRLESARDEG